MPPSPGSQLAVAVEGASEIDRLGGFVLQAYVKAPLLPRPLPSPPLPSHCHEGVRGPSRSTRRLLAPPWNLARSPLHWHPTFM